MPDQSMTNRGPIGSDAIAAAAALIRPHVRRTPNLALDPADFGVSAGSLALKLEMLQHTGSFKVRGAFTNLLMRKVPETGVVAASGGNHGVAVAFAAKRLGIPATVFVPSVASRAKQELIAGLGARLVLAGDRYADALAASEEFLSEHGGLPVHAFDQFETLLGQGTLAMELEEDAPELDTLLVAVGGGGLIGGIAAWYGGRIRVVGVEPELSPTLRDALASGRPVDAPAGGLAADSLAPRRVGELMFPIARQHVDRVVTVPDAAIASAHLETPWYGSRQMTRHLRRDGHEVGRKRVRRLMAVMGLVPIYQRARTTVPNLAKPLGLRREHRVWPNLLRGMYIGFQP